MNIYAERCVVLHKYSFLCRVIQFRCKNSSTRQLKKIIHTSARGELSNRPTHSCRDKLIGSARCHPTHEYRY